MVNDWWFGDFIVVEWLFTGYLMVNDLFGSTYRHGERNG